MLIVTEVGISIIIIIINFFFKGISLHQCLKYFKIFTYCPIKDTHHPLPPPPPPNPTQHRIQYYSVNVPSCGDLTLQEYCVTQRAERRCKAVKPNSLSKLLSTSCDIMIIYDQKGTLSLNRLKTPQTDSVVFNNKK